MPSDSSLSSKGILRISAYTTSDDDKKKRIKQESKSEKKQNVYRPPENCCEMGPRDKDSVKTNLLRMLCTDLRDDDAAAHKNMTEVDRRSVLREEGKRVAFFIENDDWSEYTTATGNDDGVFACRELDAYVDDKLNDILGSINKIYISTQQAKANRQEENEAYSSNMLDANDAFFQNVSDSLKKIGGFIGNCVPDDYQAGDPEEKGQKGSNSRKSGRSLKKDSAVPMSEHGRDLKEYLRLMNESVKYRQSIAPNEYGIGGIQPMEQYPNDEILKAGEDKQRKSRKSGKTRKSSSKSGKYGSKTRKSSKSTKRKEKVKRDEKKIESSFEDYKRTYADFEDNYASSTTTTMTPMNQGDKREQQYNFANLLEKKFTEEIPRNDVYKDGEDHKKEQSTDNLIDKYLIINDSKSVFDPETVSVLTTGINEMPVISDLTSVSDRIDYNRQMAFNQYFDESKTEEKIENQHQQHQHQQQLRQKLQQHQKQWQKFDYENNNAVNIGAILKQHKKAMEGTSKSETLSHASSASSQMTNDGIGGEGGINDVVVIKEPSSQWHANLAVPALLGDDAKQDLHGMSSSSEKRKEMLIRRQLKLARLPRV